ncbi:MAG: PAAR-like domain-containing protein [Sandaracinaceae bacterium]
MAEYPVNGREADTDVIVSTGPDVCLTPVGGSMVPVAYCSVAFLGDSQRLSSTVLDNGHPDFNLNSRTLTSTGHEPGVGTGVVSGGYLGPAFVSTASPTVFTDTFATTRHRDPAFINRPDVGAIEPSMPPTNYHDMCVRRVEGRGADPVFNEYVEAQMARRLVEPGTNQSHVNANAVALLVTDAEAEQEEDFSRREGETVHEYRERMMERIRERPVRGDGPQGLVDQIAELNGIEEAIQSDPDFYAWDQNISPDLYHNPTGQPGIAHNPVLSQGANGDPGRMATFMETADPYSFAGADGQAYSGDAHSVVRESSGIGEPLYAIQQQRQRWLEALDAMPETTYGRDEAIRDARTLDDIRNRTNAARRMGTLIRGGTSIDGQAIRPDGPNLPMPDIGSMF